MFGVLLLLCLLVGFIITYFWWFVAGAVLVGLVFAARAIVRKVEERRQLEAAELTSLEFDQLRRAERQKRWTLIGDPRAIYGEGGDAAQAVTGCSEATGPQGDLSVARMTTTPAGLDALARDKPKAWPQVLFGSILVQRSNALVPRLLDSELGFTSPSSGYTLAPWELAPTIVDLLSEMRSTGEQAGNFMNGPAFMRAFTGTDDAGPDPAAVRHIANRLMDYFERLLELSERCRALPVLSAHVDIVTDCARMLDGPLQNFREFIGDYVDLMNALPVLLDGTTGTVELDPISLYIKFDSERHSRIRKRLDAITGS